MIALHGARWRCDVVEWTSRGRSLFDGQVVEHLTRATGRAAAATTDRYLADGSPCHPGVHLSVSHEVGLLCLAWSTTAPVGVDLCGPVPQAVADRLVARWLGRAAAASVDHRGVDRPREFAQLWASVEAVAKANRAPLLPTVARIVVAERTAYIDGLPDSACTLWHQRMDVGHLTVALRRAPAQR